jgi:1,4-dihydroxy-2-naphthoate octaprenyltransferase
MAWIKTLLGPMRLPFLFLTPACIFLGYGSAVWTSPEVNQFNFLLALVGGVAAHISVNALNEYSDFRSGLDYRTQPTPFSGGSGTLPSKPEAAYVALTTGLLSFAITGLIGIYFVLSRGLALLPLGLLGLAIIAAYTRWLCRIPIVCLLVPGLGFGTLMVMGTDYILTANYSWTSFFASLTPFFAVSNLLLLNQFPDVEADESIGRRHFPITIGRPTSAYIYTGFLILMYISIVFGILLGFLPLATLLGLSTILISVPTVFGVFRYSDQIDRLLPYLGLNVLITLLTPVLVAVGLTFF